MEQDKLEETDSQKSINWKIGINLILFVSIIVLAFVIGGGLGILFTKDLTTSPKEKAGTDNFVSTVPLDKEENLAKAAYLRILSLTGDRSRTWSGSNKDGYDVCGYTEAQIKEFVNFESFKEKKYHKIGWESAEWSPGCKNLYFQALLDGGIGESWLYGSIEKKTTKLPNFTFFGFLNDDFMLSDGVDDRITYWWEGYKLYDIQNNKIVADIGLSNNRFRNPGFHWSFNYGPAWEFLSNESESVDGKYGKVVFKVNDWTELLHKERETALNFDAGILTSSRGERTKSQLKVEFYSHTPEFNKEKYRSQKEVTGPLSGVVQYYPIQSPYPSDDLVSCDVWYMSEGLDNVPAAIRLSNKASEKDCVYDIQVNLINRWLYITDEFGFAKEF